MAVVNTNYLPGDPMLVDRIVYELKAQGIFDQFRKECIADVDTKPAYQNLRQRVEGSVAGFLKKQKWKPEMNKNQVREMLRKSIYESGFLETGVDRIVNQVVNPKIEKIFQPKVAEVVYKYLGIEKPITESEHEEKDEPISVENLLPTDLEAVSPESETIEKKQDKSFESQTLDDSKNEDDESPPFEPLEEQPPYLPVEENSVDSHMSGFSGLVSHDSNSNENTKAIEPDIYNQDSQISKHSSDDHVTLSVAEETETKLEGGDDSRASKSSKSRDSPVKNFDLSPDLLDKGSNSSNSKSSIRKDKTKPDEKRNEKKPDSHKHSSRHDSKSESRNDKKNEKKDSKDRHKDSRDSSKDSRERRDSKSSHSNRERRSSSNKHSSSSREHSSSKKESSSKDDKLKSSSNKDIKRDSKNNSKSDKHRRDEKSHRSHSSSSKKDKESSSSKKESRKESKDDHFSSKSKKSDRRSTDRDSNDGQSGNSGTSSMNLPDTIIAQQSNKVQEHTSSNSGSGSNDSGASDNVEIVSELFNNVEENRSVIKLIKPKFASNIHEARKLMKIRKHLHKLEQRMFEKTVMATTDEMNLPNDTVPSEDAVINQTESLSPEFNNSVSAAAWDAIEAKLSSQIYNNSTTYNEYSDCTTTDVDEKCLYLPNDIPEEMLNCKMFIERLMDSYDVELNKSSRTTTSPNENFHNKGIKRKMLNLENDVQNNNKKFNNNSIESHEQLFSLPLSPAESDNSIDKKLYPIDMIDKQRKIQNKAKATQRYSSDDLYKPRLFNGSRRRTGKSNILE